LGELSLGEFIFVAKESWALLWMVVCLLALINNLYIQIVYLLPSLKE